VCFYKTWAVSGMGFFFFFALPFLVVVSRVGCGVQLVALRFALLLVRAFTSEPLFSDGDCQSDCVIK